MSQIIDLGERVLVITESGKELYFAKVIEFDTPDPVVILTDVAKSVQIDWNNVTNPTPVNFIELRDRVQQILRNSSSNLVWIAAAAPVAVGNTTVELSAANTARRAMLISNADNQDVFARFAFDAEDEEGYLIEANSTLYIGPEDISQQALNAIKSGGGTVDITVQEAT